MKKRGFLKAYLIIAIAFGIVGIVDSIFTILDVTPAGYLITLVILAILFFLFNIVALPVLYRHQAESIALVLPVYHIIMFILFSGTGLAVAILNLITSFLTMALVVISIVTSLFEILFSLYIYKKLRLSVAAAAASGHTRH